ncbi:M20 family metallopeptidase [Pectinatus sottacetonis]|uniref:M20 family metallopeptidase n=1 Tax=Pectinatus sottacetonis TaxID=1002795 RepID=UPI0018C5AF29|nr:ArgE/DapE family deacylase [Pectinatus sottacetonis]
MNNILTAALEKNKKKYIKNLINLIKCDTHDIDHGLNGGLEKNGQEYLEKLFNNMGASDIVREPLTEEVITKCRQKYHEGNPAHDYKDRYNLYAQFKGGSGKTLLFNGHIDTMPVGNKNAWRYDPFQGTINDNKIYGVGACDMKAGLMASIMAVELIKDAGFTLPGTVKITSVCDEEGGGNGSIIAAASGQKADAVIVCEPTNYELIAAHMGWIFFKVEFEGIAVHSGLKNKGINAIEKAIKIIEAVNELEHSWLLKYKHPLLPPPSGNIGMISGGEAGSTVPDYCCFQTCVHYQPGMTYEQVAAEYTNAIMIRSAGDEWLKDHKPKISIYQTGSPFEMDLTHPLVGSFQNAYQKAMHHPAKIVGSPAGCDSRSWHNIAKCPTLQYGPGRLEQCHSVNEYVEINQYLDAIKIYANLILDWCS